MGISVELTQIPKLFQFFSQNRKTNYNLILLLSKENEHIFKHSII